MFIIGILVFVAGIFFVALIGADYNLQMVMRVLFDWPTTFSFIVVIAAIIIATDGFKTFVTAVKALLSKKYSLSATDKEKAIRLFKLLGRAVISASILFTMMGLILTLYSLSDPNYLGPKIALALNSIFQGAFINLVLIYPAINVLQTRYSVDEKTVISEKQVIDKLLELCYKQGISPEEILDANEIYFKKYQ